MNAPSPLMRCAVTAAVVAATVLMAAASPQSPPWPQPAGMVLAEDLHSLILEKEKLPSIHVDCGGHYAETCSVCAQGHHALWCNGDCTWVFGSCQYTTPWVWFKRKINDFFSFLLWCLVMWVYWSPLLILLAILMGIYAAVYKGRVVDEMPYTIESETVEYDDWVVRELGTFAMFKAPNQCLWACFCTPVLAAKNFYLGKSMAYWPSIAIMFLMYTPLYCVAALMRTIFSSKVQRNLRHQTSFASECVGSCCCLCCVVGRESIEVDEELVREVRCPFKVIDHTPETLLDEIEEKERACHDSCFGPRTADGEEGTHHWWGGSNRHCGIAS